MIRHFIDIVFIFLSLLIKNQGVEQGEEADGHTAVPDAAPVRSGAAQV